MGAADFKFFRVILQERKGGTFNIVGLIQKIVERIKVSVIKWALDRHSEERNFKGHCLRIY